jgi:6-phosphofructokinase 1
MTSVWNNNYVHVPIREAVARKKVVRSDGRLWSHVIESTGQPTFLPA